MPLTADPDVARALSQVWQRPGHKPVTPRVWVPETLEASRGVRVLVQDAAESIVADDVPAWVDLLRWQGSQWCGLAEGPVRAVGVEVVLVLGQYVPGVRAVQDEDLVEQFTTDAADEAFSDRVRPGSADRVLDDIGIHRGEHSIERRDELGLAVPDQEADPGAGCLQVGDHVTCRLGQPLPGGMRCDAEAHWFRHGYATGLLRAGTPVEVVSKLLGHASVTTTSQTYAHLVLGLHVPGVAAVQDEDLVEQFMTDGAHEAFRDRVRSGSPDRGVDDVGADRGEHGIE